MKSASQSAQDPDRHGRGAGWSPRSDASTLKPIAKSVLQGQLGNVQSLSEQGQASAALVGAFQTASPRLQYQERLFYLRQSRRRSDIRLPAQVFVERPIHQD